VSDELETYTTKYMTPSEKAAIWLMAASFLLGFVVLAFAAYGIVVLIQRLT
jgi:hypothetical protein